MGKSRKSQSASTQPTSAGQPTSPTQPASTGGHTFRPNLDVCRECHEHPQQDLERVQQEIQRKLAKLKKILDGASDTTSQAYQDALRNYNWLKNERSLGFHNVNYARALLEYSLRLASQIHFAQPADGKAHAP